MTENTTHFRWRSSRVHRGTGSSQLPRWIIPVVTVVIAIVAAWAMETLQEQAIEDRTAQTAVTALAEDVAQQQIIEDGAVANREVTPETTAALAKERRGISEDPGFEAIDSVTEDISNSLEGSARRTEAIAGAGIYPIVAEDDAGSRMILKTASKSPATRLWWPKMI